MSQSEFSGAAQGAPITTTSNHVSIGVIGGGMSGTLSVVRQIEEIEKFLDKSWNAHAQAAPSITINLFDIAGDPYDHPDYVFFLNQPVSRMSIYPDRENDFMKWILEQRQKITADEAREASEHYNTLRAEGCSEEKIALHHPGTFFRHVILTADADSYMPRAIFGQYMNDRLDQACAKTETLNERFAQRRSRARITVNRYNEYVDGFDKKGDGFVVMGKSPSGERMASIPVDRLVISSGHVMNELLKDLRGMAGYGDTPFTMKEITDAVQNARHTGLPILLAGTGQAALDALGALAALDYDGKIIAVSGEVVEPWPQDHKLMRVQPPSFPYSEQLLDTLYQCVNSNVPADEAYARFSSAFQDMMHQEAVLAVGPAHLIKALYDAKDQISHACNSYGETFGAKILELVQSHDNNSTAPGKFSMYAMFKKKGQLDLRVGRVAKCDPSEHSYAPDAKCNRFNVTITDPRTKESFTVETGGILNSASMGRAAINAEGQAYHPVIGALLSVGAIQPCPLQRGAVTPVDSTRVLLVGTSDGEGPFGVPYNRDEIFYKNSQMMAGVLYAPQEQRLPAPSGSKPA